jgi:hypothetical protein
VVLNTSLATGHLLPIVNIIYKTLGGVFEGYIVAIARRYRYL